MDRRRRILANWGRLVRSALSPPSQSSSASPTDVPVPTADLPAFDRHNDIKSIIDLANQIQSENVNVSSILFAHAYSLSQSLDPNSKGRGVLVFKSGLLAVIKKNEAQKAGSTSGQEPDIVTLRNFYRKQKERLAESAELQDASKIFTTLRVLKDVIYALAQNYPTHVAESLLPPEFKKEMELDAKRSEAFQPYNIIPLEAPDNSDVVLNIPEIKAVRLAIQYPGLQFARNFENPHLRKPDIFDALEFAFGFQTDNVRNQREHLVLLLANAQSQLGNGSSISGTDRELDEDVIRRLCSKILSNYEKWCIYIHKPSVYEWTTIKNRVALVALYLCIWGEAANVRFLPECICYIFHQMTNELSGMLDDNVIEQNEKYCSQEKPSFLETVIKPIYDALKMETTKNAGGKADHSKWRNYDDFNEFFWSSSCFKKLGWPFSSKKDAPFFSKTKNEKGKKGHQLGKTSFVEHRTFLHLYRSFLRVWILLVLAFQGLTIIAFRENFNLQTLKILLTLGLAYFVMKFIESVLDVILMLGAYASSRRKAVNRIFVQLLFFGAYLGGLSFLYIKMMRGSNTFFQLYLLVLGVYVALNFFASVIRHIPLLRRWLEGSDRFRAVDALKWLFEERYFVGRGLFESPFDYLRYVSFWVVVLGSKFTFSYFLQIKPLVGATNSIVSYNGVIVYKWHDFISKNNKNLLTIFFLWAPVVLIYLLDISIWYTVWSAVLGGLIGAKDRLGEIRSIKLLRERFETFPEAFVKSLTFNQQNVQGIAGTKDNRSEREKAASFAPFWNEIIHCLRTEDYITNRERDLLVMPSNKGTLSLVQWPLFLLVSKVFLAIELAMKKKESSEELWERLSRDQYMTSAVREVYESVKLLLNSLLTKEDMHWFRQLFEDAESSILNGSFFASFKIDNIQNIVSRITALTGLLVKSSSQELKRDSKVLTSALRDLWGAAVNFSMRPVMPGEGPNFKHIGVLKPGEKESIKRLHSLLTIKESASTIPKNLEARRRLQFFTNSLFMKIPAAPAVRAMKSFCVYTPYYSEIVMYSMDELRKENEDGISTLFYLQKIFPDEWKNFLEKIGYIEKTFGEEFDRGVLPPNKVLELRLWASYRGQTLARTVRGMMYYRRALLLQSFVEDSDNRSHNSESFEKSDMARAYADMKFVYVITCQIFGQQKAKKDSKADDILYLLKENEGLRVAYIHDVETKDGKDYYSKLVKGNGNKDQEIYSIKLPGNPILGEGKPENQNHAVIFTRGDAVQTIDMNQDNYFEEALKMRNLLEEFKGNYGIHPPTILGVREHVFTGSVSSLAWFMSNQETSFVTLGQRVLARPLKVRMHYGHPDVFDRVFHLTRGGFSKASKSINISEDIYAGFNSTLRQGNVTHHEYIQVGKGRDVGLNQIALFEAKVSSGNGEQSLSRDVYRLGQLLDFFRMLSFYVTSVGYYVCTMMTVLVVYVFLYGKAYLALSGVGESLSNVAIITNNQGLQSALNTQFLFQIGVFTAIPMIMGFILEQGVLNAIVSFVTMQLQLCSVFFTFSLGTRTHYFGRTILHGGAKYRATGRGFVVQHIKFADNYRLYSRSHFVKALEVIMLLLVYLAYGYESSSVSYILLSFSSWFLALSWLFAPFIFNPSGFEWQKTVADFDDWANWLLYRGGVGVKSDDSWETWWEEEHEHIRSTRSRILETILCLRFFFFQYGIVYHLKAANGSTSLVVYGVSWIILGALVLIFKILSFKPKTLKAIISGSRTAENLQIFYRYFQGFFFLLILAVLIVTLALTPLSTSDVFASILALVPTGWGILSIAIAWKPVVKRLGLWSSLPLIARAYDALMGMIIFFPIAVLSWFPFISTFQTRIVFNQAFSRGLEISLILAGNRANVQG